MSIKVINLKSGHKRVVYGELVDIFDLDYSQKLSELEKDINIAVNVFIRSKIKTKTVAKRKSKIKVYSGANHIDIIEDRVGSLNWLIVEDHLTAAETE